MEFLHYWKILRRRWWLLVVLALLGGALAWYYVEQQIPQYKTTTTLFLNRSAASPLLPYQETNNSVYSLANTYVEFMRTRSFAEMVASTSGLPLSPAAISGALSSQYVIDTQFFRISATHPDPQAAQILANTAAQVLISENVARQKAAQKQIEEQRSLDPELQQLITLRTVLNDELKLYTEKIANLQQQIVDLELRQRSESTDQRLVNLRDELVNTQQARAEVLTSLAQAQAALLNNRSTDTSDVSTAVVVDEAPLSTTPLPNRQNLLTLLGALAGLGLGAAISLLIAFSDRTVRSPETLDTVYGLPTIGVIGTVSWRNGGRNSPLVSLDGSQTPLAESFRSLRTNIKFAGLSAPLRSLLITSAGPGEGKTFVSANLAISLAQLGMRVVLVDADLRRPSQHKLFEIEREPGFTNLLIDDQGALEDYLQPTRVETLKLLTSGVIPPNPAELLGSPRALQLMEQLKNNADIVIFDSPPAATVADSIVLAPHVDAVLQVVSAGQTRIEVIRRCRAAIEQVGAHTIGPVLNRVRNPDMGSYHYYYSYKYHSNGNGSHKGRERARNDRAVTKK